MAPRLDLQTLLVSILGSKNVYFQPPPNIQMKFPAIVYKRDSESVKHAANKPYANALRYQVTVIDSNPDSEIPKLVSMLPLCSYERWFAVDNLNHDVYNLFF